MFKYFNNRADPAKDNIGRYVMNKEDTFLITYNLNEITKSLVNKIQDLEALGPNYRELEQWHFLREVAYDVLLVSDCIELANYEAHITRGSE